MSDDINPPQVEIVYESISETASRSNRLNYERIKELCTEAQAIRVELHKSQSKEVRDRLDAFVEELRKLRKSTSKHLDSDEVISDMGWIIDYARTGEWLHVTRWLSNIDSSLREMWSNYMDSINRSKKEEVQ